MIGRGDALEVAKGAPRLRWVVLAGVALTPVAIILAWRAFALAGPVPQWFQAFDTLVLLGSFAVVLGAYRHLRARAAWLALAVGVLLGGSSAPRASIRSSRAP